MRCIQPYSYCINNPAVITDPNGKWIYIGGLNGENQAMLEAQMKQIFGGNVKISLNGGFLTVTQTGKLDKHQQAFYNMLSWMTKSEEGINVYATGSDGYIKFESYESMRFDLSDMAQLPLSGPVRTKEGWDAHFFGEQWHRQVNLGIRKELNDGDETGFYESHVAGGLAEYIVTGVITTNLDRRLFRWDP